MIGFRVAPNSERILVWEGQGSCRLTRSRVGGRGILLRTGDRGTLAVCRHIHIINSRADLRERRAHNIESTPGQDTGESKMIKIEDSIVINRPVEKVFTFAAAVENLPRWNSTILEAKNISGGPLTVGSRVTHKTKFLGRQGENKLEFTEFEPNRKISWKYLSPFAGQGGLAFEAAGAGITKVSSIHEYVFGGILKLAEPLLGSQLRQTLHADLGKLKTLLEAQANANS